MSRPMSIIFITLLVLSLLHISFAFPVSEYLYYNEDASQIVTEDFSYASMQYSLVKVNGKEAFLLDAEGDPIKNVTAIKPVLRSYYSKLYYPSEEDMAKIRELLLAYNNSRNDGFPFPKKEENTCRQFLFLDGRVKIGTKKVECVDDESCLINAQLVFGAYGGGSTFGDINNVVTMLKPFAFASNSNEEIMQQSFMRFNNINDDTLQETLVYIRDSIPTLRLNFETIRNSPFRTPVNTPEDHAACFGSCYQMCPQFDFNMTVLDQLEAKVNKVIDESQPFTNYATISLQIETSTNDRINFRETEDKGGYFYSLFAPLKENATITLQEAEETLSTVVNLSLRAKVEQLKELTLYINQTLELRNFTAIPESLIEYQKLIQSVHDGIPGTNKIYLATQRSKNEATTMILLLETRNLNPNQQKELKDLKSIYARLDTISKPGLTTADYNNITHTYQVLTQRLQNLMKSQEQDPIYFVESKYRGFARKTGQTISLLLNTVMPSSKITQDSAFLFGFSVLTFLSLVSLFGFIMLSLFASFTKFNKLSVLGGAVIMSLFVILSIIFSGSLYYFLDKTTNEAMLNEFLLDFEPRKEVHIIVDGTHTDVSPAMLNCAQAINTALIANNKAAHIFEFQKNTCRRPNTQLAGDRPISECNTALKNATSIFLLNFSNQVKTPTFSTIFTNRMNLAGDKGYYENCAISGIFLR